MLLLTSAAWACTALTYFAGVMLAAGVLAHAQTSTAEIAALILIAAEFVVACFAVAFVYARARRHFQGMSRFLWVAAFALLQFGTFSIAAFVTLVVLNR